MDRGGIRALDIDSAVLLIELRDLGARGSVGVAFFDSVQDIFVRKRLRFDHRPRLEEVDSVVVIVTADAGNSLAEAEHLIVNVGRVVHIRAAIRCAVIDLEHIEIFELGIRFISIHRPVRVVVANEETVVARGLDDLVDALDRPGLLIIGLANVAHLTEEILLLLTDIFGIEADLLYVVRILGIG